MKRFLLFALALSTPALAQAAPPTTPQGSAALLGTVTLRDVPADHWARSAVELMVQKGVLTGFPDGTFRGDQPLTRYQAALIFSRLRLDSLQLSASERALLERGMQSVSPELGELAGRVSALEVRAGETEVAVTAVRGDVGALRTEMAALQQALLSAQAGADPVLEQQLALLAQVLAEYQASTVALERDLAGARQLTARQQAELDATRQELAALRALVEDLGVTVLAVQQAQASALLGTSPTAPPTIVIADEPDVPFRASATPGGLDPSTWAVGLGGSYVTGLGLGFHASIEWIPGTVGVAAYVASGEAIHAGLDARVYLTPAGSALRPYVAAGGGVAVAGGARAALPYVRGAAGLEYNLATTLGVFGEIGANYYFGRTAILDSRFGAKVRF